MQAQEIHLLLLHLKVLQVIIKQMLKLLVEVVELEVLLQY
jgi:hypothetical protein